MIEKSYSLPCGELRFATDSLAIASAVDDKLATWNFEDRKSGTSCLRFSLFERGNIVSCIIPETAVPVYSNQILPGVPFEYFRNGCEEIFKIGEADLVTADFNAGVATGMCALGSQAWSGEYVFSCVVLPILIEWLSRHRMYAFHGGAVADGEDAIVLFGSSGHGKTTAVVALTSGGFQFLTDDMGLLVDSDEGLEIMGLPEPVNLCADAPALFEQLGVFGSQFDGSRKKAFPIEDLLGCSPVSKGTPRLLLFPTVDPESPTKLEPIKRGDAVDLLLRNCLFLTGMIEGCGRFQAFLRLIEMTRPQRLVLGKGLTVLPGLVRQALSEGSCCVASQSR